jgi:hypothetical protein
VVLEKKDSQVQETITIHTFASPGMSCTGSQVVLEPYIIITNARGLIQDQIHSSSSFEAGTWRFLLGLTGNRPITDLLHN